MDHFAGVRASCRIVVVLILIEPLIISRLLTTTKVNSYTALQLTQIRALNRNIIISVAPDISLLLFIGGLLFIENPLLDLELVVLTFDSFSQHLNP